MILNYEVDRKDKIEKNYLILLQEYSYLKVHSSEAHLRETSPAEMWRTQATTPSFSPPRPPEDHVDTGFSSKWAARRVPAVVPPTCKLSPTCRGMEARPRLRIPECSEFMSTVSHPRQNSHQAEAEANQVKDLDWDC
jgi:hypothetical protein